MKSVSPDVYEKTEGQTDKQTNKPTKQKDYTSPAPAGAGDYKQTDKPTKQKDYTSPALAGAGDYNKETDTFSYLDLCQS